MCSYRQYNDIPDDLGTAVTVQSMVFGNMGESSGTGVMFTRNPSTGTNENFGKMTYNPSCNGARSCSASTSRP